MFPIFNPAKFFSDFPYLQKPVNVTSPATGFYNCVAWAVGDTQRWWWPSRQYFWPLDSSFGCNLESFKIVFEMFGYSESANSDHETQKEKVAIYAFGQKPTHAARQLPNGKWSSKCGSNVDIEHDLGELEGPAYGTVALVLERPNR